MDRKNMQDKWNEYVKPRREAIEDFNDLFEDELIVYADNEIRRLKTLVESWKCRKLQECSIPEYLSHLSLDQLECCAERANEFIEKFKEQDKIKIWLVTVDGIYVGAYKECDFGLAREKLIEEIKKETDLHKNHVLDHCNIESRMVYENELAGYLEWNDE